MRYNNKHHKMYEKDGYIKSERDKSNYRWYNNYGLLCSKIYYIFKR